MPKDDPTYGPDDAVQAARALLTQPPAEGALRAFTLRIDLSHDSASGCVVQLLELANRNDFVLTVGDAVRTQKKGELPKYLYTVGTFTKADRAA